MPDMLYQINRRAWLAAAAAPLVGCAPSRQEYGRYSIAELQAVQGRMAVDGANARVIPVAFRPLSVSPDGVWAVGVESIVGPGALPTDPIATTITVLAQRMRDGARQAWVAPGIEPPLVLAADSALSVVAGYAELSRVEQHLFVCRQGSLPQTLRRFVTASGQGGSGLSWDSAGKRLCFDAANRVWLFHLENGQLEEVAQGRSAAISPSGQSVAFIAPSGRVALISLQTRKRLDTRVQACSSLHWSPDDRYLLYEAAPLLISLVNHEISVLDRESLRTYRVSKCSNLGGNRWWVDIA